MGASLFVLVEVKASDKYVTPEVNPGLPKIGSKSNP